MAATVAYDLSANAVTLTPATALTYGTTYTATVSGVVNAAGDPMTAPFTWSFTTVPSSSTTPVASSSTFTPRGCGDSCRSRRYLQQPLDPEQSRGPHLVDTGSDSRGKSLVGNEFLCPRPN